MQVLVAPTREEADRAHKEGVSMEVGIHSFRNIWRISWPKRIIWAVLGVISTVMHLFWNSAVFSSIPYTIYPVAITTSDFRDYNDDWSKYSTVVHDTSNAEGIYSLRDKNYTRVENAECIGIHVDPRYAGGDLILVSKTSTAVHSQRTGHANQTLINGWDVGHGFAIWNGEMQWICTEMLKTEKKTWCTNDWAQQHAQDWRVYSEPIQYCLQGPRADNRERCGLHFSKTVFVVVGLGLVLEAGILFLVACSGIGRQTTMVTLGDAQVEYLRRRDSLTGLIRTEFREGTDSVPVNACPVRLQVAPWETTDVRWYEAVGPKMWIGTALAICLAITISTTLFFMSLSALRAYRIEPTLPNIWASGIGQINHYMLVGGPLRGCKGDNQVVIGHILLANGLQVLWSMLYLLYNNCLTCQVLADQWTRFLPYKGQPATRKNPRVSAHQGLQRSSYMLTLPFKHAAPMMLAFTIMHTLLARSVFLVRTAAYGPGDLDTSQRLPARDSSRIGFSSMALLLTMLAGLSTLFSLFVFAARKYKTVPRHLPRMANKTAFISAACHRPDGDEYAHLFPVTFMAITLHPALGSGVQRRRIVLSTDRYAEPPGRSSEGERELFEQPLPVRGQDEWARLQQIWPWKVNCWPGASFRTFWAGRWVQGVGSYEVLHARTKRLAGCFGLGSGSSSSGVFGDWCSIASIGPVIGRHSVGDASWAYVARFQLDANGEVGSTEEA
ncbi:hypothetical protein IQ07DRAFT_663651 [Pyrenochaeta sp. DS3sAY3a]|nr:hypothetical protein IQ07DRAFT_663651 [Pyrenochaeta sp. DS3sAY3a]